MKIDIGKTNGGAYRLEIGNTLINFYWELKDLFKDLEAIIKIHNKDGAYDRNEAKTKGKRER